MTKFRHLSPLGKANGRRYRILITWINEDHQEEIYCNAQEGREWITMCNEHGSVNMSILDTINNKFVTTL